jgi:hypothetical protein
VHRGIAIHRGGAWLALFALVVQLVLSFGHIHQSDFFPLGGSTGTSAGSGLGLRSADTAPIPLGKPGLALDDCAICATMHMMGSSALPAPITVAGPTILGRPSLAAVEAFVLTAAPYLLFQTRAPPLV